MSRNSNLHKAKKERNDEFFTLYEDIEKEMVHYKDHFNGKTVYCNCDDARESNFFKYFSLNFEFLGLKKLITTGYKADGKGVVLIYEGDKNGNRLPDTEEITIRPLQGNGDFRSEECIEFLKEADIIVTNPPFSLFREYIAQLMDFNKKFIVLGNMNAITYKEIFPLIKENKMWWGVSLNGSKCSFIVPENYEGKNVYRENGVKYGKVNNAIWFTNLDHAKRNKPLDLYKHYSNEYKHYDNYDAIEVGKVCDIPMDYDGVMGVPITFLDKYCPEQFEILGLMSGAKDDTLLNGNDGRAKWYIDGKGVYARILIRHRKAQLMEYGKKFIIIGPQNALTYKEIFPLIKSNQIWWGFQCVRWFKTENATPKSKIVDGITLTEGDRSRWWTNIEIDKRNIHLDLYKHYSNEYKHYDNYDAIEVSKTMNIPYDYQGVMGVPVTFLDKYCPDQFEILGLMSGAKDDTLLNGNDGRAKWYIDGKGVYARILIRHRK